MNSSLFSMAEDLVDQAYVRQGAASRRSREKLIKSLLANRKIPRDPWDERTIGLFLNEIASMDSNNFPDNVGVGEREGRVFSALVRARHMGLAHGIGRSGDVGAIQPKAAGSSLLMRLTTAMVLHLIKISGVPGVKACLLLPTATGMALLLTFSCLRLRHRQRRWPIDGDDEAGGAKSPRNVKAAAGKAEDVKQPLDAANGKERGKGAAAAASSAEQEMMTTRAPEPKYIIWPRIDQKTCLKAIVNAGFTPVIIENKQEGDQLYTNVEAIEQQIRKLGAARILCVLSTSSCFAPRAPDKIEEIALLCKRMGVAHVVNNAYGLQSPKIMGRLDRAARKGRIDAFVQSTDKNLMVPVGGSIIAGFDKKFIQDVSKTYPGRASMSPVYDVFLTLVGLGETGYASLIRSQKDNFRYFKEQLAKLLKEYGERVLEVPDNPISLAFTIDSFSIDKRRGPTYVGSMLFKRCVSGPRAFARKTEKSVCGIRFTGYGSHCNAYPHDYLVMACAIGMTRSDIDRFLKRLNAVLKDIRKEQKKLREQKTSDSALAM
mmetsp:Transcript_32331/g.52550  ORF Transcript_32331/g.52550 Transcript_32331/m.52550 type:complete len:545 (-) Transcript_32331:138-1772(-)